MEEPILKSKLTSELNAKYDELDKRHVAALDMIESIKEMLELAYADLDNIKEEYRLVDIEARTMMRNK